MLEKLIELSVKFQVLQFGFDLIFGCLVLLLSVGYVAHIMVNEHKEGNRYE